MRFFYLRDAGRNPIACVASKVAGDYVEFALSTWNSRDQFSKAIAKEVAAERLQTDVNLFVPAGPKVKTRIMNTLLVTHRPFPAKVKKAAKLWIEQRQGII